MKEHVQECPVNGMPIHMTDLDHYYGRYECQCEILRACEQRVLAEQLAGHEMAYDAGVQAARDAVADCRVPTMCIGTEANPGVEEPWVRATDALNAIDALKED